MSQNGTPQYGQPNAVPPHFHPQQRQRPSAHHHHQQQQQHAQAFNYGGAPAPAAGPFHSQPAPRPFPGVPQQPQQQQYQQPNSVPHQFQQQPQPQAFYPSHDYQQPVSQPMQQPTAFTYASNASSFNAPAAPGQPQQQPRQPGTMRMPPSGPPSQGGQQDFINQLSQNPMAGLAMNTAQDFLSKQSAIYLPGAYGFLGSVKYYFIVNNSYVKSRLKILLMPFWHRNWRRLGSSDSDDGKPIEYAPPSRDLNAPDLYLPLMGFLTYILIVGYSKGASNQFSPDVIGKDASYCLVMQLIEIGIMAACLYLLSSSISFLDLVSFSGYKYIPLVINTIVYQLFGSIAYYIVMLYTGIAVSYFTLNCMKGSVAEPTPENRAFRNYLLFGVSCLQLVLVSWISYTTAPRE